MKNPWFIVGVLAVVLFGGAIWYASVVAEKNNVGITFSPHIEGNENSDIKLVEYSDLQCPACAAFEPILTDILNEYGDKLSFEYKHFPLPIHNFSQVAAQAAEAAGQQDNFFPYHDLLFANQETWSTSPNPQALFIGYADTLGLDIPKFKRQLNSSLIRDKVKADAAEARDKGLTGTPTFFLNGERMNFTTYEDFRSQITSAIDPSVETTTDTAPTVEFGI